ncbi:MAG TPA: aldo/keto reductase [Chloroflexia bacterium]|nr:aldo/keto reductase [Chloroflexia bacterium]
MGGFERRKLGKTGLEVSPLGIGGGNGISSEDLLYAFDKGINYFFFSSNLHHFTYRRSAEALRKLCSSGSAVRDKVVLATVSYVNDPEKLLPAILDQMSELGVDYIDVFHWGWVTERDEFGSLYAAAQQLKDDGLISNQFRWMQHQAGLINQELVKLGVARYVGASFHARSVARQWMDKMDVLMLRYNLAHLGVEKEIFPFLAEDKDQNPGIVAFNVAHEGSLHFSTPPQGYPSGLYVPTIPDCYRFALTNPAVDLVLAGLTNRGEVDAALAALEKGPFNAEEYAFMREYGAMFTRKVRQQLAS